MNRIATGASYQSALLNLMSAQSRQDEALNRISTGKIATDLAGFGRGAESLTTLKAAQSRVQGFLDTGKTLAARLSAQDLALNQVGDAVGGARADIANALALDSGTALMTGLEGYFQSILTGLNARHQGAHLFAGGNTAQAPVAVTALGQLAAAPDVASVFSNDELAPVSRLGEAAPVQTGYLADELGTEIFEIFRDIRAFADDPATGPFGGALTDAQKSFLTAQLARLDAASKSTIDVIARNGALQNQTDAANARHTAQIEAFEELVGKKADADMARAATDLQLAQVAVQASAQVVSQLNQVSLLNFLR